MRRALITGLAIIVLLSFGAAAPVRGDDDLPPIHVPLVCSNVPFAPAGPVITMLRFDTRDESVTITNLGLKVVSLAGYRLQSDPDQGYDLPAIELAHQESVRIHSGPDALDDPPHDLFWTERYMWRNEGDTAELYDADGALIDVWVY